MLNKMLTFAAVCPILLGTTGCGLNLFKKADKETVSSEKPVQEVVTPKNEVEPILVKDLDGEWIISQVGDTKIEREENYPYIHFVSADGTFYASNGCNILNGSYMCLSNETITFANVLATMKYCADTPFDTMINAVFADGKYWTFVFDVRDHEPYLYLKNAKGENEMILHKPGLDFMNGDWRVEKIGDEKFEDSDMTIFFDVEARKVHGNTGCNSFNGEIYVDPQNKQCFSLSNMAVTMRMCPNIDQQSKFLVALEKTVKAKYVKKGEIELRDDEGKATVKLVSIK